MATEAEETLPDIATIYKGLMDQKEASRAHAHKNERRQDHPPTGSYRNADTEAQTQRTMGAGKYPT